MKKLKTSIVGKIYYRIYKFKTVKIKSLKKVSTDFFKFSIKTFTIFCSICLAKQKIFHSIKPKRMSKNPVYPNLQFLYMRHKANYFLTDLLFSWFTFNKLQFALHNYSELTRLSNRISTRIPI